MVLEERSLPTPEVRSSNPIIGKFYMVLSKKTKVKKRGQEWLNFKRT